MLYIEFIDGNTGISTKVYHDTVIQSITLQEAFRIKQDLRDVDVFSRNIYPYEIGSILPTPITRDPVITR